MATVHYICPQLCNEALASGIVRLFPPPSSCLRPFSRAGTDSTRVPPRAQTTLFGGGTGPSAGTSATTCTPSGHYLHMMMAATDGIALNFGFTGKGNDSGTKGLEDEVRNGAIGLKVHEVREMGFLLSS